MQMVILMLLVLQKDCSIAQSLKLPHLVHYFAPNGWILNIVFVLLIIT